jgi:hypothetical protein
LGIACSPSRTVDTTSGSATSESIAPAAKKDLPNTTPALVSDRKPSTGDSNRRIPNRASTTEGAPASISTVDSTTRANPAGRPYSLSHTATPTPIGPAIPIAMAAIRNVPISGSRKPPVWFWVYPTCGLVQIRSGCRNRIPWIARKTTIPTVMAQNSRPRNHANASPIRSVSRHDALESAAPRRPGPDPAGGVGTPGVMTVLLTPPLLPR